MTLLVVIPVVCLVLGSLTGFIADKINDKAFGYEYCYQPDDGSVVYYWEAPCSAPGSGPLITLSSILGATGSVLWWAGFIAIVPCLITVVVLFKRFRHRHRAIWLKVAIISAIVAVPIMLARQTIYSDTFTIWGLQDGSSIDWEDCTIIKLIPCGEYKKIGWVEAGDIASTVVVDIALINILVSVVVITVSGLRKIPNKRMREDMRRPLAVSLMILPVLLVAISVLPWYISTTTPGADPIPIVGGGCDRFSGQSSFAVCHGAPNMLDIFRMMSLAFGTVLFIPCVLIGFRMFKERSVYENNSSQ